MQGHFNLPVSDKFAVRFAFADHSKDSHLNGFYDPNGIDHRWFPADVLSQASNGLLVEKEGYQLMLGFYCNNLKTDDTAPGFDPHIVWQSITDTC